MAVNVMQTLDDTDSPPCGLKHRVAKHTIRKTSPRVNEYHQISRDFIVKASCDA